MTTSHKVAAGEAVTHTLNFPISFGGVYQTISGTNIYGKHCANITTFTVSQITICSANFSNSEHSGIRNRYVAIGRKN